ncbi:MULTISPECIES: putative beta-lysine N-acetyltransferase [Halobacillus]|uniref:putative beta-lysine N-acetyltransferase n=1 Tax=Halobacillus TaxID=45667 RepID=UPI00136D910C|nr:MULTISPECIES: putative beta-lysine N-acetyltransferase [Halobacillus]MYL28688.1 putative beta-lysine N-acetyltransferase [Halobacillus halophilus]MYL36936.1 putative beta-lysine N-acetyltransferase [Halobacillus litoralis]
MSKVDLSVQTLLENDDVHLEPVNKRIKVYQLPDRVTEEEMEELSQTALENDCDKIIFYVRANQKETSIAEELSFIYEGEIRGFFQGEDALIYARYLNPARSRAGTGNVIPRLKELDIVEQTGDKPLPEGYEIRWADEQDADEMAALYQEVFPKYPTPIHDPGYIRQLMREHVYFSLIHDRKQLVSSCSADLFPEFNAAEFTDCATLPSHRGKGLLSCQYPQLEGKMKQLGVQTMFSYTRAASMGMNIIAKQQGFTFGGCMIQNSMIGSGLEDMNIWFKAL